MGDTIREGLVAALKGVVRDLQAMVIAPLE